MKERPILFTAAMVRAILEGRKTQTRRVIAEAYKSRRKDGCKLVPELLADPRIGVGYACPYGVPGELLWVRETWNAGNPTLPSGAGIMFNEAPREGMKVIYRADRENDGYVPPIPWRPSIFMPRWASRITLEITDVRVQRLQDISEEDAIAEGVQYPVCKAKEAGKVNPLVRTDVLRYLTGKEWTHENLLRAHFAELWDSINGKKHPWASNPWVWAITFQRRVQ